MKSCNHFQLEKNEFSVVLMEFCYHYNGDFIEFLDIIMEFLWSLLHHIVEFLWSLEILLQNFGATMWSFHGVLLSHSGVFLFNFNTVQWNSSGA